MRGKSAPRSIHYRGADEGEKCIKVPSFQGSRLGEMFIKVPSFRDSRQGLTSQYSTIKYSVLFHHNGIHNDTLYINVLTITLEQLYTLYTWVVIETRTLLVNMWEYYSKCVGRRVQVGVGHYVVV